MVAGCSHDRRGPSMVRGRRKKCPASISIYEYIMKSIWRYWARALGEKIGENNKRADTVAFIRTLLILQAVICNIFIVWNIIRRWNE
jgi:hypothetical protein